MSHSRPRRMHGALRRALLPVLILLAGYAAYKVIVANPPEVAQKEIPLNIPAVEVQLAAPEAVQLRVHTQGSVRASTETSLKAEVSGRVIWQSPALVNGGEFSKDDELLRLDDTDYRSALASAETALVRADAERDHAQREFDRIKSLERRKLASTSQIDGASRSLKLANAQYREAEINRQRAQIDLERTVMRAPYAGRVRQENVDLGQFVSRGEEVARIYSTDSYEIHVPIGIEQLAYLDIPAGSQGVAYEEEQALAIITGSIAGRDFVWEGKLTRTEGEIDARTRLAYGVVQVKNEPSKVQAPLLLGLFVRVDILGRRVDNVITLPRSALRDNETLLIVDEDSRLRYRKVSILRLQGDEVLVSGGLAAGEKICISPLQVVVDGMKVRPELVRED